MEFRLITGVPILVQLHCSNKDEGILKKICLSKKIGMRNWAFLLYFIYNSKLEATYFAFPRRNLQRFITGLTMEGPFQLLESVIDTVVTRATPAVFLIRRIEETEKYAPHGTLKQKLKRWLSSDYRVFCFEYVQGENAVFDRQCRLWHNLGGPTGKLDNEQHPEPDEGQTTKCPVCFPNDSRSNT